MIQFGRALSELNIEILCANSSQEKGRVERMNRTLVGERQLGTDIALLTFAQDVAQPIRGKIQRPMQIIRWGRGNGNLPVIALREPRQESVAVVHAMSRPTLSSDQPTRHLVLFQHDPLAEIKLSRT
ncbi:Mobile element protein [Sinorhizobium alkalisoli]|nr:Mobile element protein [Sinorhizobium alkalisoli]